MSERAMAKARFKKINELGDILALRLISHFHDLGDACIIPTQYFSLKEVIAIWPHTSFNGFTTCRLCSGA